MSKYSNVGNLAYKFFSSPAFTRNLIPAYNAYQNTRRTNHMLGKGNKRYATSSPQRFNRPAKYSRYQKSTNNRCRPTRNILALKNQVQTHKEKTLPEMSIVSGQLLQADCYSWVSIDVCRSIIEGANDFTRIGDNVLVKALRVGVRAKNESAGAPNKSVVLNVMCVSTMRDTEVRDCFFKQWVAPHADTSFNSYQTVADQINIPLATLNTEDLKIHFRKRYVLSAPNTNNSYSDFFVNCLEYIPLNLQVDIRGQGIGENKPKIELIMYTNAPGGIDSGAGVETKVSATLLPKVFFLE